MYKLGINIGEDIIYWYYSTQQNTLYNTNMEPITINETYANTRKKSLHIRLSLGMACNYKCGYCSEHPNKNCAVKSAQDYVKFITALKEFVDDKLGTFDKYGVSFWGGEPLLYMDAIKILTPIIKNVFGSDVELGLCTNGELLDNDIYDFLTSNEFRVGVSYDGPGQFVRNKVDVFQPGTLQHSIVRKAMDAELPWYIQPVFHKHNPSVYEYVTFIRNVFGDNVKIGEMSAMRIYDSNSMTYALDDTQLANLPTDIVRVMNDQALRKIIMRPITGALCSFCLNYGGKPLRKTHCFVGRDYLAVDLSGDIWACHNNIGQLTDEYGDTYKLGSIYTKTYSCPKFVRLTHKMSNRCEGCLHMHICRGGCPMTSSTYDNENCKTYYFEKLMVWQMLINCFTGGNLVSITKEGD